MTAYEWLLFIAMIDGPLIALVYLIIKRIKMEMKEYDREADRIQ
jgi:hypothetical protein